MAQDSDNIMRPYQKDTGTFATPAPLSEEPDCPCGMDGCGGCSDGIAALQQQLKEANKQRDNVWWERLGQFRMALHNEELHGHYNLLQKFFGEDIDTAEATVQRLRGELDASTRILRCLNVVQPDDDVRAEVKTQITSNDKALRTPAGTPCPDCDKAAKHAFSDATTPGFFSPYCDKHQPTVTPKGVK